MAIGPANASASASLPQAVNTISTSRLTVALKTFTRYPCRIVIHSAVINAASVASRHTKSFVPRPYSSCSSPSRYVVV
ncbi:hypothetical protein M408DRAFT_124442 [Serendipita vermifera MAFF 305830]|uniref:Uncharacterized protein n=1 Tax=Serendipita vermifera MAFF 305830 TaxID=933852 RepID=A0A0C3AN82_SERVB|nr:hypothetical protein M408DRAFT_124442 [Serendipita vermifera MAFF 305830]